MSAEIPIELPMPGAGDLKGCRLGGEAYAEKLVERICATIRIADLKGVLSDEVCDRLSSAASGDMRATALRVASNGFGALEIKHFWRGMRRGYKRAITSAQRSLPAVASNKLH